VEALEALLRRPRYELMPTEGVEDLVVGAVPPEVKLTLTVTAERGIEATLDHAGRLASAGFQVVPHLAARLVRDGAHLAEILARLRALGLPEVFVIGGDATEPAGEFTDALSLLRALADLDHRPAEVGVTAHPAGGPAADAGATRVLLEKQPLVTYAVSNLCLDGRLVAAWLAGIRRAGVELPLHVGLPGPVAPARLARVMARIGVRPGPYDPDRFLRDVGPALAAPDRRVAGLHVFTFNEVEAAERWRRRALARAVAGGTDR
jgi:methylenetetrahydrofolate reductase (NADPH)